MMMTKKTAMAMVEDKKEGFDWGSGPTFSFSTQLAKILLSNSQTAPVLCFTHGSAYKGQWRRRLCRISVLAICSTTSFGLSKKVNVCNGAALRPPSLHSPPNSFFLFPEVQE